MERLTKRGFLGITYNEHRSIMCSTYCDNCSRGAGDCDTVKAMINKLADYEDIGTPEELKELKENGAFTGVELAQIAIMQKEWKSYKNAEEQGLLVRLPCKIGDTMYDIVGRPLKIVEHKVDAFHIDKKGVHLQIINGALEKKQGAKVYFSREEAEKKLEEMSNGL